MPAAPAERVQHDLHEVRCACGRPHVAARPAGVPDSALSIGQRLRALAVYLVIFQHVPVERCRQLIADVTGAAVSEGFIHSSLARAASLARDVVVLIRALITAAPVAGFDETTLRSGPAGEKKYVHGAFTERYSAFWLGARSLEAMEDAGILADFRIVHAWAVTGLGGQFVTLPACRLRNGALGANWRPRRSEPVRVE